ncbi:OprD family outer membrane porin [Vibrio maritimus]
MKKLDYAINAIFLSGLAVSSASYAEGLLEDSKVTLSTRNIAMYLDTDTNDDIEQFAWAQGVAIDYTSGYLSNFIGIDATYSGAIKLGANEYFAGRNLLRNNNGEAEGFNKISQVYGKLKLEGDDSYARGYYGWKSLHKFGAITVSKSRAVVSSYKGASGEIGYKGLELRGAFVDTFSDRDTPLQEDFETLSGEKINHIITGDLTYRWGKKNSILLFSGQSQDYLRRSGLEAKWQHRLPNYNALAFSGYLYHNQGLDDWEGIPFESEATHYNINLDYLFSGWKIGGSYAYTDAKSDHGLGIFYWDLGKNTDGNFNSVADGPGIDFNKDGEHMVAFQTMYDMSHSGIPGLKFGGRLTYGFGIEYQGQKLHEGSLDLLAMYSFQEIKGLSMMLGIGPGYSFATDSSRNPVIENGSWKRAPTIGGMFKMDYKFNIL